MMDSPPSLSIVMEDVPAWLRPSHIQNLVNKLPAIAQVRTWTRSYQSDRFTLILDFDPGADPSHLLNLSPNDSFITIDHQEFPVTCRSDNPCFEAARIVSESVMESPSPCAGTEAECGRMVKLGDLGVGARECSVCRNDLEEPFATPCWDCKRAQCYSCLSRQFHQALEYCDEFPAKCCGRTFHPNIAQGILSDDAFARYKLRFEERLTPNPTYCPIPTCSAFIPVRRIRSSQDDAFKCHVCQTSLCKMCKAETHADRKCTQKRSASLEIQSLLKKFGYKQCPKCGAGVAKMFGCSHMQCVCGAHWCWTCQKKMDLCNEEGCNGSYSDEEHFDDTWDDNNNNNNNVAAPDSTQALSGLQDSNGQTVLVQEDSDMGDSAMNSTSTTAIMSTSTDMSVPELIGQAEQNNIQNSRPASTTEQADVLNCQGGSPATASLIDSTGSACSEVTVVADAEPEQKDVNLDDPAHLAWEHEQLDFGEEPAEDDMLDMWGCSHNFCTITNREVPRYWMTAAIPDWWTRPASQREIECMSCWAPIKMTLDRGDVDVVIDDAEEKQRHEGGERGATRCRICSIIVCSTCKIGAV